MWYNLDNAQNCVKKIQKENNMKYEFAKENVLIVTELMVQLGIPAHLQGYSYIRTSVLLILEDEMRVTSVTKLLYPDIAKIHSTTSTKVESSIRKAIEVVWNRNSEHFNEYFNANWVVRPTNSEFLATFKEVVKQHIK